CHRGAGHNPGVVAPGIVIPPLPPPAGGTAGLAPGNGRTGGYSPRGGGGGTGGGGARTGGARSRPKTEPDRYLAWDVWWELNDDTILWARAATRASAGRGTASDAMLGAGEQIPVAKITAAELRTNIAPAVRKATKDSYAPAREE